MVNENLTPLIGAQAAQNMKLITVNNENFVTTSLPCTKQAEVKVLNAGEEVNKRFSDVFDRSVGFSRQSSPRSRTKGSSSDYTTAANSNCTQG